MTGPLKIVLILSENWTLTSPRDLRAIVGFAVEAEAAGIDAVMVSEHIVLGPSADAGGTPSNPRGYALPGNQDPATPWPDSLTLLAAIAGATARIRLVAGAVIPPLRHPLLIAKPLATLDLLSEGRLIVQPTVSWHRDEYEALGVPFEHRGELLDEHLAAWEILWRDTPATFEGAYYRFHDVSFEPKPFRPSGPTLWFGGSSLHERLVHRIVAYGSGFNPLGRPARGELERLAAAMNAADRDMAELEMVGGTRAIFPNDTSVAALGPALDAIPDQIAAGFTTFCIKPSQFIDDATRIGPWCREVVERVTALAGG